MNGFDFNWGYDNFISPINGSEMEGFNILDDGEHEGEGKGDKCGGKCDKYCGTVLFQIQLLYILAAVLWIYIVYFLNLWRDCDIVLMVLLAIPIIVFAISFNNSCNVSTDIEGTMLQSNYLSFGFLITIILLNWNTPVRGQNKNKFFEILILAFILIMISMIDFWTSKEQHSFVVHLKTVLQTTALVLLSIALYGYYHSHQQYMRDNIDVIESMPDPYANTKH